MQRLLRLVKVSGAASGLADGRLALLGLVARARDHPCLCPAINAPPPPAPSAYPRPRPPCTPVWKFKSEKSPEARAHLSRSGRRTALDRWSLAIILARRLQPDLLDDEEEGVEEEEEESGGGCVLLEHRRSRWDLGPSCALGPAKTD